MPAEQRGAGAPEEKGAIIGRIMIGARVGAMVCLGVRLGLYRELAGAGPLTSEELAGRSGYHERWVREWLRGQAAAGVIDYRGDGRFELTADAAGLLANEESVGFLGHFFDSLPQTLEQVSRLPESFRTGLGVSWDDRGSESAELVERVFGNWYRQILVPVALPQLDGVVEGLGDGAKVADVGCGSGLAMIEMAKAFPKSEFHGYETSELAIARGRLNADAAGTDAVSFHNADVDPLPANESFNLICTFDCLHDMTHPEAAAAAIRAAIKPDGWWFIADVNCSDVLEENLANPLAPLLYSMSVVSCMSSGLSEPGGAGLGTLGLPEPKMRELVMGAGFTRFRRLDLPHPANAYYEARP